MTIVDCIAKSCLYTRLYFSEMHSAADGERV